MAQSHPAFFGEKSTPHSSDSAQVTRQKINGALLDLLKALDPSVSGANSAWSTGVINPAATATAEQVGSEGGGPGTDTECRTITFFGLKSEGNDNASDVFIRPTQNGTGVQVEPGWSVSFTSASNKPYTLGQFWCKIGSAADGTLYAYSD